MNKTHTFIFLNNIKVIFMNVLFSRTHNLIHGNTVLGYLDRNCCSGNVMKATIYFITQNIYITCENSDAENGYDTNNVGGVSNTVAWRQTKDSVVYCNAGTLQVRNILLILILMKLSFNIIQDKHYRAVELLEQHK